MYNHYKHGHLNGKVRGILNNKAQKNNYENNNKEIEKGKVPSPSKLDSLVSGYRREGIHADNDNLEFLNHLWSEFKDEFSNYQQIVEPTDSSYEILNIIINDEVFKQPADIKSRKDYTSRIHELKTLIQNSIK
ncbi:hypothetical protein [Lysinibacillus agricola]|uniref:hypothetical protein n=1 Tax=Lysinibacillus agricola TaxID=2590012 RepID=UPI003C25BECD